MDVAFRRQGLLDVETFIWFVVITVGLFVAYMLVSTCLFFRNLLSVDHYREVALTLERIRNQASLRPLAEAGDAFSEGDPRRMITSAKLAMAYTIRQEDELFIHHISVTTPSRGRVVVGAGETFAAFFAWRLGLVPAECAAFLGLSAFHLEFTIPEQEQASFMNRSLALPAETDLQTIRDEVLRIRGRFEFFDARQQIEEELAAAGREEL